MKNISDNFGLIGTNNEDLKSDITYPNTSLWSKYIMIKEIYHRKKLHKNKNPLLIEPGGRLIQNLVAGRSQRRKTTETYNTTNKPAKKWPIITWFMEEKKKDKEQKKRK